MSLTGLFDRLSGREQRSPRPRAAPKTAAQPREATIIVDGAEMIVSLRPHPRATKLRLRYDPITDRLSLTTPPRMAQQSALDWAAKQQLWIGEQRAKRMPVTAVGPGVVLPWGEGTLLIDWQPQFPRLPQIVGDRLQLGGMESAVPGRIARWLRAEALHDFTERTRALTAAEGLTCTGVAIGDPRGRWGSCTSAGKIRYSWRLILAPDYVRQALVAHEVAHLVHMDHSPAFHALVAKMAGAEERRSRHWLKMHGRSLHRWDFGSH